MLKLFSNKWLFISYLTLIILLVALPINSTGSLNNITIITFRGDYFFHALAFMPWFFFKPAFNQKFFIWLIFGILFASSTEAIQYSLPYRTFNVNDLVANMLGISLGTLLNPFFKQLLINKSKIQC